MEHTNMNSETNGNRALITATRHLDLNSSSASAPTLLDASRNGSAISNNEDNHSHSDATSVCNNPSIVSMTPDRYGFLGGEQYTHESEPNPPADIIRKREQKWMAMLENWDHYMRKDFKTVRKRCRKGIPRSVRRKAWFYLCGAYYRQKQKPNLFSDYLRQEGKAQCIEDIKKDVHRQFPMHEIFTEEGHGQEDLFRVLKAYSIHNAEEGYCQAHAPIAATLLMHMPAEEAFWCLVSLCERYLPGYYSPGMKTLQEDGDLLFGLLKQVAPPVYKHLKKQKIEPVFYMTEWFLCAFTRTLPWSTVLRVWDMFLCEGVKVLFRVGLVLLKYTLNDREVIKRCPTMYETLSTLKSLPNHITHEQFMVFHMRKIEITDDDMRKEQYKQRLKRAKQRQVEGTLQKKKEAARLEKEKKEGARRFAENGPNGYDQDTNVTTDLEQTEL